MSKLKKICVVDGQGGGIGSTIVKRLKETYGERVDIIALGTNAIATAQMMKARANRGATGENAIRVTAATADAIIGPVSIVLVDAMMGEVTAGIAAAICTSPAKKYLLPLTQEPVEIIGARPEPLPHLVDIIVNERMKELIE
ncbi:MAG: DUF3842 family protein [Deltaproteobacteria bacterium]|nr:DUF3842 family protein [Deltaproteobacteria bacterium]